MNRFIKLSLIFIIIIESKLFFVNAAPTANSLKKLPNKSGDSNPEDCSDLEIHDERQNGTENYRIAIDGLIFMVASPESLASLGTADFFNEQNSTNIVDPVLEDDYPPIFVSRPTVETTTEKSSNIKQFLL